MKFFAYGLIFLFSFVVSSVPHEQKKGADLDELRLRYYPTGDSSSSSLLFRGAKFPCFDTEELSVGVRSVFVNKETVCSDGCFCSLLAVIVTTFFRQCFR